MDREEDLESVASIYFHMCQNYIVPKIISFFKYFISYTI